MPKVRTRLSRKTPHNALTAATYRAQERIQIYCFSSRCAFNYQLNYDYANSKDLRIGRMNVVCVHCGAKKWSGEAPGLCCAGGKVILPNLQEPPDPLKSLILGTHPLSKHFLDNARKYNSLFQMTSFGTHEMREGNFMPTYKIQGQVYHLIGSLLPNSNSDAQFLQIYFISEADQTSLRSNMAPSLRVEVIEQLQTLLNRYNCFILSFKYNLEKVSGSMSANDFRLVIHADKPPVNEHRGRYNAPTVNEVAALMIDEEKGPRDIVLHSRTGQLQRVSELHQAYDPLQYPLMFVRGEYGYCVNIPNNNQTKFISCMQFYAYRFMVRDNSLNHVHYFRNLLNQYSVDMMAKMISERLNFIRRNQQKLRAEEYIHLRDAINDDSRINVSSIGQKVILPSSFTGSVRYMQEKTQDAMTYVRHYGRPDLFITFTCNPEWPEIIAELFSGQKPHDRHDIVARVFHLKMKKLMYIITKKCIFGEVRCHMLSVEWQKRGLPHCHILLWLQTKIQPNEIDSIICAEIPDQNVDPDLYDIVCKNMIHGPCGLHNIFSPCMAEGKCLKKFPRNFCADTQSGEDGYPTYRRRSPENGGKTAFLDVGGVTTTIDNRWVVPYCPLLLRSFSAHINVEYCHSVKAIKYICKYINKGTDQATFSVQSNADEIQKYINGRYISTSESFWRFFDFPIHERYPTVVHLAVHLENGQRVYFSEENVHQILENPRKTTLMAFFELCSRDPFARTLLYHEVPAYYTWGSNTFTRRKRGASVEGNPDIKKDSALGRVYNVHPNQTECFYLRLLLHHVRGPTSFKNLRTVNGVEFDTFQAACRELQLLEDDNHWKNALAEAALLHSPSMLRELFSIILVFCQPSDAQSLWSTFRNDLCEDFLFNERRRLNDANLEISEDVINQGLIEIEDKVVGLCEKYLTSFGLPSPNRSINRSECPFETMFRHPSDLNYLKDYLATNVPKMVADQRQTFAKVVDSIDNERGLTFFLDAPGGCGKTFLLNLLLAYARSNGHVTLAAASSGIAATLLSGGRTAHSAFKLPLNVSLQEQQMCSIRKNGSLAKLLQEAKIIVWDECTMTNRAHIEAVDRTLKDLRSNDRPFGGITMLFAGDFRQTLPVVAKGTRADIIKACFKASLLWNNIQQLCLRTNMRAHLNGTITTFPQDLLNIGDGKVPTENGYFRIDSNLGNIVYNVDELVLAVYPNIEELFSKPYTWLCERVIVAPKNKTVDEINNIILDKVAGEGREYMSSDTVINSEDAVHYPTEFLNSLNPSGLPPYKLKLKLNIPIILLRNLKPPNLCNGTRLQIKQMHNNILEATILTGPAAGEMAFIPRIPMIPTDMPFQYKRLQFPVKVSFAVTINKSQGQTFNHVGIDLRAECFTHGQLYVAVSRTGNPQNQTILLPSDNKTKNVVYSEVL